jgi:hypothetical protein
MATNPLSDPTSSNRAPDTVPTIDDDLIRQGGVAGQQELATAINNLANTLNTLVVRINAYVAKNGGWV